MASFRRDRPSSISALSGTSSVSMGCCLQGHEVRDESLGFFNGGGELVSRFEAGKAPLFLAGPGQAHGHFAKKISLHEIDIGILQDLGVFRRFHPFGDGLQVELVGEINEGAHQILVGGVMLEVAAEGAVELDDIDRQVAQVAERGEAGAEIIDGDTAADVAQRFHEAEGFLEIAEGNGFGDLHGEAVGDGLVGGDDLGELVEPARIGGGGARDIHGQLGLGIIMQGCNGHLGHGAVNEAHQAELFGDRNEMSPGNQVAVRIIHAEQCLVHDHIAGGGADDGLEAKLELVFLQAFHDLGGAAGVEPAFGHAL